MSPTFTASDNNFPPALTHPQADAPNPTLIPPSDITGVTVVLLTCSYRGQEFVRVGYYVNNEYDDEALKAEPPSTPLIERLVRNILADKPRVTRFPIKWDRVDELEAPPPQADDAEMLDSDFDERPDADGLPSMEEDADLMSEDDTEGRLPVAPSAQSGLGSADKPAPSPEHQTIAPSGGDTFKPNLAAARSAADPFTN